MRNHLNNKRFYYRIFLATTTAPTNVYFQYKAHPARSAEIARLSKDVKI